MGQRLGKAGPGMYGTAVLAVAGWCCSSVGGGELKVADAERQVATEIFQATGVQGGLIVHLGCGDGKLTAALRANDSYLVQGLETDPARVAEARKQVQASGVYGPVSVILWDGKQLPYAENMVNLLVADSGACPSNDEIMRVLSPLGVAYVHRDGQWAKTVKPWPQEMDQWTHWCHAADNNAVARDTQVGPPQRMQWVAEPLWSRGHEIISSVGAVVTARGRLLYVLDEGQPGVYELPSRWVLVARNAFNGVLLWKKPVPEWGPPVARGGHTGGFRPRRLVTDGERLYLPLGEEAVLTSVDAATGKTLKTLEAATGTSEILCQDGLLVAVVSARAKGPATLLAARPETLDVLWQVPVLGLVSQTAAPSAGRLYFCSGRTLVALDATSGQEAWRTPLGKPSAADSLGIGPGHPRGQRIDGLLVVPGDLVGLRGRERQAALAARPSVEETRRTVCGPRPCLAGPGRQCGRLRHGHGTGAFEDRCLRRIQSGPPPSLLPRQGHRELCDHQQPWR